MNFQANDQIARQALIPPLPRVTSQVCWARLCADLHKDLYLCTCTYLPVMRGMGWGWRGRGGWGRGWPYGRAFGGPGWGRGNPYPFCRWFPWLPRWWWANPGYGAAPVYPYSGYTTQPRTMYPYSGYTTPGQYSTYPPFSPYSYYDQPPQDQLAELESYKKQLEEELAGISSRIEELHKKQ